MAKKQKKDIDNLIEQSGIITHHKVIEILINDGWDVLISPYYYDNINNTVREIDIIAEKQCNSSSFRDSSGQVNIQLFIECKYINNEIVFWFDNKDVDRAVEKFQKETSLKVLHRCSSADILTSDLHYLENSKVAKLFSANKNKEDIIYKAFTQCLNSKIYYDQWQNHPIFKQFNQNQSTCTKILKYPIIVCDNFKNFKRIIFEDNEHKTEQIDSNFQLEINYTYLDKDKKSTINDNFLIDVVNFDGLSSFLEGIHAEAKKINSALIDKTFN